MPIFSHNFGYHKKRYGHVLGLTWGLLKLETGTPWRRVFSRILGFFFQFLAFRLRKLHNYI